MVQNEITALTNALASSPFFKILLFAVMLDVFFGVSRAIKEHGFNSCVGIDGAIRKVGMIFTVVILMAVDLIVGANLLFLIPQKYTEAIGINKIGIAEFFSLIYILYEIVSILKNMVLCGLPIPAKVKSFVESFLEDMTTELDTPKE